MRTARQKGISRMAKKVSRGKHREVHQSLEEAVHVWKSAEIKIPQTIEQLVEADWDAEGCGEEISDDCKTSEGLETFTKLVNGFLIDVEIPFTSVRVYGKAVISRVGLPCDADVLGESLRFANGEPDHIAKEILPRSLFTSGC
jgi:hypothetical protein